MSTKTPSWLRWGLVFLACPVPLTDDQKTALATLAARAYFEDADQIPFDWGELRGDVRATSEAISLGAFCGQRFRATIHRPESGAAHVEFLITESQLRQFGHAQPTAEA